MNPGETLQLAYFARNLASKEVTGKARHLSMANSNSSAMRM